MRFLHCADLHLGQILYQNYDRVDEHVHFFRQLRQWCAQFAPDALLVSGDVFDIQQPSASVRKFYTDAFVELHHRCPDMAIVIIAGNHDSASRLQADAELWRCVGVHVFGAAPPADPQGLPAGWQERFIVRLSCGYVAALPYASGSRRALAQALLDHIASENSANLPVVLMGHTAVNTADVTGHNFEIGRIAAQPLDDLGRGYDYAALGHIHRPQTLGRPVADERDGESVYTAAVARYAGSALHVSCDEKYPHTVSLVEVAKHGGEVRLQRLRVDELRHFYELPIDGRAAGTADEATAAIRRFLEEGNTGYFRLKLQYSASIPSDFDQQVYRIIEGRENEIRYNPKAVWVGTPEETESPKPMFEIAELQAMADPMDFIEKTIDQYPGLDLEELRRDFEEVEEELRRMKE